MNGALIVKVNFELDSFSSYKNLVDENMGHAFR